MKEALYTLGNIIHHLQRERGCVALFLGSEGKLFSQQMKDQFSETDKELQSLGESYERWQKTHSLKETHLQKIQAFKSQCNVLTDTRNKVIQHTLLPAHTISSYSHELIGPLLQCMVEIALVMEGTYPAHVSAYSAFLQWKERVGLERAIGVRGFVGYSFHNQEFLERVLFLLSEQTNYQNTFLTIASETQKHILQQALHSTAFGKLDEIHAALKKSPESEILYTLSPEGWFNLVSEKIDALHTCEKELIDNLSQESTAIANPPTSSPALQNNMEKHQTLIHSLQLFSGLSEESLQHLLKQGQIRDFQKGKLLFLEGEHTNRLYVILKGWVKIFKGTAAGEETIIQMLSSGESILESAVFLGTPFPVSAQIAEDATLLSLPAPMVREQIRNNNDLALSLLTSMSHRSQNLIRQIESARLKSADERIGWFLLKLLLEQGRDSRHVKLPYDKSLIASYLDMKRETFSRALKRLKTKGFKIENDTVVIPNLSALCGFCDPETTSECALHETPACPNPQCTSIEACSA